MKRQDPPTICINFMGYDYCIPGEIVHGMNYIYHDVECTTCKDAYRTYGDAHRSLRLRNPHTNGNKRIYRCEICGYFHLSTNDRYNHHRKYYDRTVNQDSLRRAVSSVSERDLELAKNTFSSSFSLKGFVNAQNLKAFLKKPA